MDTRFRKLDEVWTSDGQKLGLAQRLFHRTEGVEPANLLYESYLEVENFELGSTYFVPTEFIEERDEESEKLKLSKSFSAVQEKTWFRMPIFAARGDGREESLPEG